MSARPAVIAVVALALAGCSVPGGDAPSSSEATQRVAATGSAGTIEAVTDGDTLRVRIDGRTERVRLLGIDTPETRRPGVRVECGGPQATAYMRRYARHGARVRVTADASQARRDRYDRLLAYVDVKGRGDAGAAMVHKGWATPYVYAGRPVRRHRLYQELARAARGASRGVWGRCRGDFHSGS